MNRAGRFSVFFTAAMLFASSSSALSAQRAGSIEVGVFGTYNRLDESLVFSNRFGFGGRAGIFVVRNLQLEASASLTSTANAAGSRVSYVPIRSRLVYNLPVAQSFAILIGGGYVHNKFGDAVSGADNGLTGLFGIRYRIGNLLSFRADGVYDYVGFPANESPVVASNQHVGAQFGFSLVTPLAGGSDARRAELDDEDQDRDGDGVSDGFDMCPNTPSGTRVGSNGCPVRDEADADRDGVSDNLDRCPNTPAGLSVDAAGCGTQPTVSDRDQDGVADAQDACPNSPAGAAVGANGCVVVAPVPVSDTDGDGVVDSRDQCPGTPAGTRVGANGCPTLVDSDGDGILDTQDRCPNTASNVAVDVTGCAVRMDADGDGVVDTQDRCPNTPAGVAVDIAGCPVPVDSDRDGVADPQDQCPGTPAGSTVGANGCPVVGDADRDGVIDSYDRCPNTPAGTRVDAVGCPMVVDSDGDGVMDSQDRCPNTPAGGAVDAVGCPSQPAPVAAPSSRVLEGVTFMTASAGLTRGARRALEEVARALRAEPGSRWMIAGHTDNEGSQVTNTLLSQRRANAVRDYLIQLGVPSNQLVAQGFGPDEPIADNATAAGRARNRRVELIRLN